MYAISCHASQESIAGKAERKLETDHVSKLNHRPCKKVMSAKEKLNQTRARDMHFWPQRKQKLISTNSFL